MTRCRTFSTLFLLLAAVAPLRADDVRTLGNKTVSGKIVGVSDKEVTVRTEAGMVAVPLHEILALDLREVKGVPAGTKYSDVRLLDETALLCSKVVFAKADIHLTLLSGQQLKLPLTALVSVLHDAQDANLRKEWEGILAQKDVKRDRVVILKNDELNAVEGTFGDIGPKGEKIQFRLEGGLIRDIPFQRLQGMIFYRTEAPASNAVCQVYDVQGNSLAALKVSLKDSTFTVTTVGGIEIAYNQELIARFDYNMGKLTFLSDVTPARVDDAKSKVLGRFPAYRANLNLGDTQIQLGDKVFAKGLSMWAPIELEYNLGGKYKEFRALVGVDGQVGGGGKVRLLIERDGEKAFAQDIEPGAAPVAVNFPVNRAKRLRIVVTSEEGLGFSAHVEIAEARVTQ